MSEPTILNVSNNAQTQLSAGINNSVTTIPVAPTSVFPTSFPFNVSVGNEIMQVTAATGSPVTSFTVATRGTIENTSADAHVEDTIVQLRWTAGAYYSLVDWLTWLKDTYVGNQIGAAVTTHEALDNTDDVHNIATYVGGEITTHAQEVDPTSANTVRNKHLSNNDLKGSVDHIATVTGNPHVVTKTNVGLSNVSNDLQAKKSDYDTHVGTGNIHFLASSVTKANVGLANVTNDAQAKKSDFDIVAISTLPVGSIIVDLAIWHYKGGDNYVDDALLFASPIRWIKVAQDHANGGTAWTGAALITERLIGKYNFDADNEQAWVTSDIRAWLNSVFKESLSAEFRAAIQTVTTKTKAGHTATQRTGDDDIFLLSEAEMAGAVDANDGVDLGYFTNNASRICQGPHSGAFVDRMYWTRSPHSDSAGGVRYVFSDGDFYEIFATSSGGVRPALVLANATLVTKMGGVWVVTQQ